MNGGENEDDGDSLGLSHEDHKIVLETMDGEFAASISIVDLGADASPLIVDSVEDAILREVEHLVVEQKTIPSDEDSPENYR